MNRRGFLRFTSLGSILLSNAAVLGQQSTVDANTQFGRIRGIKAGEVNIFKGVPYGATTAAENRFMPPTAPTPWQEYKEAFAYGPAAPQSDPATGRQQDGYESEDCLVLNLSLIHI